MSGLCGWVARPGAATPAADTISAMAQALTRHDGSVSSAQSTERASIAAAALHEGADVHREGAQLVAVWGRPRLAGNIGAPTDPRGAAHAIAAGYASAGPDVVSRLTGHFALAIVDGERGTALLAVDRFATRPLCYSASAGRLVFASTLDAIARCGDGHAGIDAQALYDYVHFHMIPGPRTVRAGCERLLPGTCLQWRNGKAETSAYWRMRFREDDRAPFPELKRRFLHVLQEAVREAAAGGDAGAFLSGGTDSSTLAGMLCEVTGRPARTYSIGFAAEGYDEMAYARIAAQHFGTSHHEYYVTPDDVVAAIPDIARVHDQPFGNASAVPTYYCARLAKQDGVGALLGGDGGDELFGGNERYAKQHLYSLYSDLPEMLRRGLIEPVAARLPEAGLAGKAQRYMRNAVQPMPARYDNHNLLEHLGPGHVFTAAFLETVDTRRPQADLARAYGETDARSLINRMLALDLKYTLADNDLPKVARSCELAAVDVRFPMLADAVVDFSARLAPRLKLRGTRLRWFFKEALRGFLPDAILAKTKHGFGLPFGPWLREHAPLRELAMDSLADLKRRHIVRAAFIDELAGARVQEHAAYYGTMVWILMMLEQWFRAHAQGTCVRRAATAAVHEVGA